MGLVRACTAIGVCLLAVAFAPWTAHAALWTSDPGGTWTCTSGGNACVKHTGFDPMGSTWGYFTNRKGNCTNYAAYRLKRNGAGEFKAGDAIAWKDNASARFGAKAVNQAPAIGAIAWWGTSRGEAGHVAYVEKIAKSGALYISESVWNLGSRRKMIPKGGAGWPEAFLHIKDKPNALPIGKHERVEGLSGRRVRVTGWALDPDSPRKPVRLEAWIDGMRNQDGARKVALGLAELSRPDVAKAHRGAGSKHGFRKVISGIAPGRHVVRVYALNGADDGTAKALGARLVAVPGSDQGESESNRSADETDGSDEVGDEPDDGGPIATGPGFALSNAFDQPAGNRFLYGATGDVPVAGDWNGDGVDTPGVFRPSTGEWLLSDTLSGPATITFSYGRAGDIPVVGDWNGDGKDTQGIVRQGNGRWILSNALGTAGTIYITYGVGSDIPVAGDWNGDGKDTQGVFRPSTASWLLSNSLESGASTTFSYGRSSDLPVVGDWNGDRIDTAGVFRPSGAQWILANSLGGGQSVAFAFGLPSDTPIVGDWNGDRIDTQGIFTQ